MLCQLGQQVLSLLALLVQKYKYYPSAKRPAAPRSASPIPTSCTKVQILTQISGTKVQILTAEKRPAAPRSASPIPTASI